MKNICRDSTVGAIRNIGIIETKGNIGTMDNLRTMETQKKILQELWWK